MTNDKQSPSPSAYQLMGLRLQKIINATAAQRSRHAVLQRHPDESAEVWSRILEEIGETENVTVAYRDADTVDLFWTLPPED